MLWLLVKFGETFNRFDTVHRWQTERPWHTTNTLVYLSREQRLKFWTTDTVATIKGTLCSNQPTCMKETRALGACSLILSMAIFVCASSLQASMTSLPVSHSDLATSRPTPLSAPVTIATWPVILISYIICTTDTTTNIYSLAAACSVLFI